MKIQINNNDIYESLSYYLNQNSTIDSISYLISPLPIPQTSQRGETCKLVALANAINQEASKINITPIPLYKNKTHSKPSLRQLAKENGSVVGEIYSIESLKRTAQNAGFDSTVYAPNDELEYIEHLKRILEINKSPIVFFDIDLTLGENFKHPYIGDGRNEHAAIVVGYYENQHDETHFIIMQYNEFYDFGGMELAFSSLHSLNEKREPETFKKVQIDKTTMWMLDNEISSNFNAIEGVSKRSAPPMKDTDTPLKGKIMSVTVLQKKQEMHPLYRFYTEHRKNFPTERRSSNAITHHIPQAPHG